MKERLQTIRQNKNIKTLGSIITAILCIGLVWLFFATFKAHQVSGQSMAPTFANHDRLLIHKKQLPSRYAIVTFAPKDKPKESYVKRVIGLPGDSIQLDGNAVYLTPKNTTRRIEPINATTVASEITDETFKILVSIEIMRQLQSLKTIPEGQYFVLGDNREHSTDSRHLGLIDAKQIEGTVVFRYGPLSRVGTIH